jgi:hypothetical protein
MSIRKTHTDHSNYLCDSSFSNSNIKKTNTILRTLFNKYLLPSGSGIKIRFKTILTMSNCYIFETPNKSIYIINDEYFNERFKGPMIKPSFKPNDLDIGSIYHIENQQFKLTLFEYKKKIVNMSCYLFETSNGMTFLINPNDISNRISNETNEHKVIMSGEYFEW